MAAGSAETEGAPPPQAALAAHPGALPVYPAGLMLTPNQMRHISVDRLIPGRGVQEPTAGAMRMTLVEQWLRHTGYRLTSDERWDSNLWHLQYVLRSVLHAVAPLYLWMRSSRRLTEDEINANVGNNEHRRRMLRRYYGNTWSWPMGVRVAVCLSVVIAFFEWERYERSKMFERVAQYPTVMGDYARWLLSEADKLQAAGAAAVLHPPWPDQSGQQPAQGQLPSGWAAAQQRH
eukprot:TRINITY_DN46790_c0_g1_i1.p2 TRINITY_DN46790_c0_g1~~TRINITY_DN46790_c0_g1_i1.p2  ORF type:complete len:257 (+),score=46.38 TRINITY_DN46790_c0_g1_i1:73-771(+)